MLVGLFAAGLLAVSQNTDETLALGTAVLIIAAWATPGNIVRAIGSFSAAVALRDEALHEKAFRFSIPAVVIGAATALATGIVSALATIPVLAEFFAYGSVAALALATFISFIGFAIGVVEGANLLTLRRISRS